MPARGPASTELLAPPIVLRTLAMPGRPLSPSIRADMESRFGHDFSRVRVHDDHTAAQSARAVNAKAYTVGSHISFDAGRHAPHNRDGQRLLAHELAHVAQSAAAGGTVPERLPIASEHSGTEHEARAASDAPRPVTAKARTLQLHRDPNDKPWSLDPSTGSAQTTASTSAADPVIAQFDAEQYPGWQHWNLDALCAELLRWTQAAPGNYAIIRGNHGGEANASKDPEYTAFDAAKRRADLTLKALEQWAPKLKGRLRSETMLRELVSGANAYMARQITIWRGSASGAASSNASPGITAPGNTASAGPRALIPAAPQAPSPYAPRSPFADIEDTVTGIVREQPDKPGEEKSDFKKFFEAATSKGWDVTRNGQQIVNLSIKGVGRTLFKGDRLEVKGTLGPSFKLDITRGVVAFGGSISLSSGAWTVNLSFPGDTPPPDLAQLETIMSRGKDAMLGVASTALSPATYSAAANGDFTPITKGIAPLVDPISSAVSQVQGFRKMKPGVSFGLSAGSGAGPAGPAVPAADSSAPKGAFVRGVLTLSF